MFEDRCIDQAYKYSIQERVIAENQAAFGQAIQVTLDDLAAARQLDFMVALYVALATTLEMAPWPDLLQNLGWPGRVLHELFCREAGMWRAFRTLVGRRHPEWPYRCLNTVNGVTLASHQEQFVYRAVLKSCGVTRIDVHPFLPDGLMSSKADFRLTAATDQALYVEVVMVSSTADADTIVCAEYRDRLLRKLGAYRKLGLRPLVIWADQAACPRALAARLNDALALLGLPTRPPAPPAWYELPRSLPLWTGADVPQPGRDSCGRLAR